MGLVKLYVGRDSLDAHHLRAYLESEGLKAVVLGETLGAARGDLPLTLETLPSVYVNQEDAAEATAALQAFVTEKPGRSAGLRAWVCPQCKEAIEGQFDICWNCGQARPEAQGDVERGEK